MKKQINSLTSQLCWKSFAALTIAGFINAFGVTVFLSPVKMYDSGISGTFMLLSQIAPEYMTLSIFLLILNIPLFLFGLKKQGIASPYIGVSVLDVFDEMKLYGIPAGIAIQSVAEGSPAEAAGVKVGDVITAVNDTAMDSNALVDFAGNSGIGDELSLANYRQGENLTLTMTVGEQIQSALANEETQLTPTMPQGQFVQPGNPFGGFGERRLKWK